MNSTQLIIQVVFTLLFAVILVGWFARPASDPKEVATWAQRHDLVLTARNQAMVTYYVRLAITLRAIGGVGGLIIGAAFDDALGLNTSAGPGFWIWILLGWLLGASWAEYRLTRPSSSGLHASLTPRDVRDYLHVGLYTAPAIAAVVTSGFAVGGLLASEPTHPQQPPPHDLALVAAILGSLGIALLVMAAIRAVVARRQPTSPPDVVAADDAIRSGAVHHLAGGGTAAILLIAAQVSGSVLAPYRAPLGVRGWVPALLLFAALVAWRDYAYKGWRVRRGVDSVAVGS